ncbi:Cof-type HAD-IIB family hydrolase [Dehalobacter sp. DCM]|uniref:Cof-type HAD-IIB family hydrolase n=1 Tax=Dehalobacter sp. DCM TaxID=2907827 RepID=UPI0030816360|nr:Cof-type HAD-IIB family hydrolase [Dehalobacter sp. DCM]
MIKLIAMDLDDTLLNDEGCISEENKEAVRRAVAQGVKVTLATGRMAFSARKHARELCLDVPIITYNGALIEQAGNAEIIYRKVIPPALGAEIVRRLYPKEIHTQVFIKDNVYTYRANQHSEAYEKMTGIRIITTDLVALLENEPEGADKIQCIGEEHALMTATEEVSRLYADRLHFTTSRAHYMDIIEKSVNKGNALKVLAEQLGILPEEVMAIGDNHNDMEMICYAGTGVAMGNALEELKEIADYVTLSNQENGVAHAIERFALK